MGQGRVVLLQPVHHLMVLLEDEVNILGEVKQLCVKCCIPLVLKVWLARGATIVHPGTSQPSVWHVVFCLGDLEVLLVPRNGSKLLVQLIVHW